MDEKNQAARYIGIIMAMRALAKSMKSADLESLAGRWQTMDPVETIAEYEMLMERVEDHGLKQSLQLRVEINTAAIEGTRDFEATPEESALFELYRENTPSHWEDDK